MLARLNVQQKLTLLLMLPFIAVFVTSVPFAIGRIDDAVAAGATVGVAERARAVGVLVQDLQEERLLALTFLATPAADQAALQTRISATSDRAAEVGRNLVLPRDVKILSAIGGLSALNGPRRSVLRRAITAGQVYTLYHATVMRLIDSLGLNQQPRADATGLRQIGTLDSVLRANEDTGQINAALVLASVDAPAAAILVTAAQLLRQMDTERFRQQADGEQNRLLNLVQQGPAAQRSEQLSRRLLADNQALPLLDTLAAAQTTITLTRVQQERIATDIATRATERASEAQTAAATVIGFAGLIVLVVIWLSVMVSRSVAGPLRRLTTAARNVADLATTELVRVADSEIEETWAPQLNAVEVQTNDEIGELAVAFNRVQETAARLMEQQIATRRNTAIMFANIARRNRSMVARQLTFIDDLERNEQNERLLTKLYRLDHLTTRLHRSADSLLVVSGVREDERIAAPAPLAEIIRSAVAEIEGYQNVRVGGIPTVTVAPQLVSDLRLVLAELLENATAFSPPGSAVDTLIRVGNTCDIAIVDHGIGMSDDRLEIENRRLVERERLDVAPTTVLGLFVVGRLARRHGLTVTLSHTQNQGTTATVRVPAGLFVDQSRPIPEPAGPARSAAPLEGPGRAADEVVAGGTVAVFDTSETMELPTPEQIPADLLPGLVTGPVAFAQPQTAPAQPPAKPQPKPAKPAALAKPSAAAPPVAPAPVVVPEPAARPPAVPPAALTPPAATRPPAVPARQPSQPVQAESPAPPMVFQPVPPPPVLEPPTPAPPQPPATQQPVPQALVPPAVFQPPVVPERATEPQHRAKVQPATAIQLPMAPELLARQPVVEPPPPPAPSAPPMVQPVPVEEITSAVSPRGLTRRRPGGHLPSFGFGSDDNRAVPITRDAIAERAELEAFALGTAQAAAAGRPGQTDAEHSQAAAADRASQSTSVTSVDSGTGQPWSVSGWADQLRNTNVLSQRADPALSQAGAWPEPAARPAEPAPPATERHRADRSRTEQRSRAEQSRSERSRPDQPRPESGRSEPARPESRHVEPVPAAAAGNAEQPGSRGGLRRRLPGTHLSEYLRTAESRPAVTKPSSRDADAERSALDSFLDGVARAAVPPTDQATNR